MFSVQQKSILHTLLVIVTLLCQDYDVAAHTTYVVRVSRT